MKDLTLRLFDACRVRVSGFQPNAVEGVFQVPSSVDREPLRIIATATLGWDHVSVSRADRCPDWSEMEQVKRMFFWQHETVMQLHVPPADHINNAEFCLHLWRSQTEPIPRPPNEMVGIAGKRPAEIEAMGAGVFHR